MKMEAEICEASVAVFSLSKDIILNVANQSFLSPAVTFTRKETAAGRDGELR
jgi:hypothetical protein